MGVTVLFIGLIIGPIVGFLAGLWGKIEFEDSDAKAKLHGAIIGWFAAGVLGLIVSGFTVYNAFYSTPYIDFFGIHLYGVVLGGWFASFFGAIAGMVSAKILSNKAS